MRPNKKRFLIFFLLAAVLIPAFFLARIPQRLSASRLNANSELPYAFLSSPDFAGADYRTVGGSGITGYCFSEDLDSLPDGGDWNRDAFLSEHPALICYTSHYPDSVFGPSKITRIECSNPGYSLFGCAAGESPYTFRKALEKAGFREDGYQKFTKNGIGISLVLNEEKTSVIYYRVSVKASNLLGVQY